MPVIPLGDRTDIYSVAKQTPVGASLGAAGVGVGAWTISGLGDGALEQEHRTR